MSCLLRLARRGLSVLALIAAAALGCAEIDYDVAVRSAGDSHVLHVTMTIPTDGNNVFLQSPRWGPGSYDYSDFGRGIQDFSATDASGAKLTVEHPDFSTWVVAAPKGVLTVQYEMPLGVSNDTAHYSGPRTYLYVEGRTQEKCGLEIDVPPDWKIRMGLDPVGDSKNRFTAPTYDVLADTPVTLGKFIEEVYTSHGKPHYMVMYGSSAKAINREMLRKICKFTSDAEGNFFGEVPYKRYVWHFSVNGNRTGGGGLEHLNGTEISLGTGVETSAQSVITHEFFHAWNVKRIRSKPLGPFNYTALPLTGALWWLEGVTDYYAIMIPSKYGWWDFAQTKKFLAQNIQRTESNPGRMRISAYDSSLRVNEANNGRGNSNGLYVSYYNTGWLLGLMLDIEIRIHSNGKHSLDDVELALWNECKNNQPGFQENEIRNLCVRFGGEDLGELYDKWVMTPGVLPVEDELAKMGLGYGLQDVASVRLPMQTTASAGGLVIAGEGAAQVITAINGRSLAGRNGRGTNPARVAALSAALLSSLKRGDKVVLTVTTSAANGQVTIEKREVTLEGSTRKAGVVTELPNATAAQLALRKAWLSPRPGTMAVSTTPMAPSS
ncbi:MAG: M61 family metallopeptidase [Fimbriimonadaceae bacterium]